jgi:hypothetical protein
MAASQQVPQEVAARLYDGEKLESLEGFPVLTKFFPGDGDTSKPLVAYIPGLAHNARISYGGHEGSQREDFLAHWFQHYGFGFLGISYPLETEPEVMPPIGGEFSLRDWGRQAAKAMKKVVNEHDLPPNIVILSWSMSGKVMQPVTTAAKALGLTVVLYVALAASPALWGLGSTSPNLEVICNKAGYWTSPSLSHISTPQLSEQNRINNGRIIVDLDIYKREYVGATPAAAGGFGFRFNAQEQKLVEDKWQILENGKADNYVELPVMAAIYPTSPLDLQHSIADKATWGFLMTYKFLADIQQVMGNSIPKPSGADNFDLDRYTTLLQALRLLIHGIPDRMITGIEGNHFFFLGEKGARQTAKTVIQFLQESKSIRGEFDCIIENAQKY